jgi:hypothetical protein
MFLNDYEAKILLNDTEILDWTGFETNVRVGNASTTFSVDLQRPIDVNTGDKVTIKDGFGGQHFTLIDKQELETNRGSGPNFSLSSEGSAITRKSPFKHIFFVNQEWLKLMCPSYYIYRDAIYAEHFNGEPYQVEGVGKNRLMIPELPGKNIKDYEFRCIVSTGITHKDIARYIANILGYTVKSNILDVYVQKVFHISSGETYWSSLARLFSLWKPMIYIKDKEINIFDVGVDRQAKPDKHNFAFTEDSFQGLTFEKKRNYDIVDHIVINGPDSQYTYIGRSGRIYKRNYTDTTLPGETIVEQYEDLEWKETDSEFPVWELGGFDERIVRHVRTVTKKVNYMDPDQRVIIKEVLEQYNASNVKISETTTEWKWATFHVCTGSVVTVYGLVGQVAGGQSPAMKDGVAQNLPTSTEWVKLTERTTQHHDYIEETGQSDTDIYEYGLCVMFKDKIKVNGENKDTYTTGRTYFDAVKAGLGIYDELDKNGYGPMKCWQLIKRDITRFDMASYNLLRKIRIVTTLIPERAIQVSTEDISIPKRRFNKNIQKRWEYYWYGNAPILYEGGYVQGTDVAPKYEVFHPKLELSHPDIITEELARKIAWRLFTARQTENIVMTLTTTIPIPNIHIGSTVTLPSCTKKFLDWNTKQFTDVVAIPGGTYWVTSVGRKVTYTGDPQNSQRTLSVQPTIELRKYF